MIEERSLDAARVWLRSLDANLVACDYTGPDPYDALTSPFLRQLPTPMFRRLAIQSVKRSPVDIRSVVGVKPVRMAKTLGIICSSLEMAPWLDNAWRRRTQILEQLSALRNPDGAWGYEFDVQMRWGGYPTGRSNVVTTAFVVDGFGCEKARIAQSVASFIDSELSRDEYIAYAPTSSALIHNANLLGAATLEELVPGHPLVRRAILTSLAAQSSSGTWSYGSQRSTAWVDSFHTAYVLTALDRLRSKYPEADSAFQRGTRTWLDEAFSPMGPRYYLARDSGPVDVHNVASSLFFLAKLAPESQRAVGLLPSVLAYAEQFRRWDGSFSTRRTGCAYVRWESAHMHRALAQVCTLSRSNQ